MDTSWIILIPTIVTIVLCLWTKQVYLGMFAGVFAGSIILVGGNPLTGLTDSLERLLAVFSSGWNFKIILFATIIGGMIELMGAAGGVRGLIEWLEKKASIDNKNKAQVFTWIIGVVLFFDQVTSEAVTASVGKTLSDKYEYSREKVAYIVDSTASPICALLPLNSWGAYIVGLLTVLSVSAPINVLIKALPFNFYCIMALLICFIVAKKDINIGPMKKAEERRALACKSADVAVETNQKISSPAIAIVPLFVLLICVPTFLFVTGGGSFTSGDASTAVFWGVLAATLVAFFAAKKAGLGFQESKTALMKGIIDMLPVAMLLVLAFALGSICSELQVGAYVSSLTSVYLPNQIMPALVFFTGCLMAFASGSSWGTFAIMIPIIVPMAAASDIPLHILLAAMLSGAIMGDHSAIMSDSTVMASIFSGCDNVDHFKTQIPYALIAAGISLILFLIVGFFM
ncbi:MAG: Na+/H+ antiporter NhaC family protein [Caldicoprobacterales bacterium]|jgi:tetracycline resistance efflux pump